MVRQCRKALLGEEGGNVIDLLARHAIDNAGVTAALSKECHQLLARLLLWHDAIEDVWPIETRQESLGVSQMQALDDFLPRALVSRGSQRKAWDIGEKLSQLTELQVLGSKIVPPLRHAVRLVNGEQADLQALQERQHARLNEPLRRQIEHLDFVSAQPVSDIALLFGRQGRVESRCRNTQLVKRGHLIVHQRNQRRHHHSQAVAKQRRHLITKRFTAACRHQHQRIAAVGHALDDRTLVATKRVVAEYIFENALCLIEHAGLRNKTREYTRHSRPVQAEHCPDAIVGCPMLCTVELRTFFSISRSSRGWKRPPPPQGQSVR